MTKCTEGNAEQRGLDVSEVQTGIRDTHVGEEERISEERTKENDEAEERRHQAIEAWLREDPIQW